MDPGLVLRGAIVGFTIAAAVGPIALLIIRRTLSAGWTTGMVSGLGVATADGIYGAVAAFGIASVSGPLVALADPLAIAGGLVLLWLGVRTVMAPAASGAAAPSSRSGTVGAYASTLLLTLANPMTILLFVSIVVGLGLGGSTADAAGATVGLFAGSLAWWLVLVTAVAAFRGRITGRPLRLVTVASGLLIALFGALSVAAAVGG